MVLLTQRISLHQCPSRILHKKFVMMQLSPSRVCLHVIQTICKPGSSCLFLSLLVTGIRNKAIGTGKERDNNSPEIEDICIFFTSKCRLLVPSGPAGALSRIYHCYLMIECCCVYSYLWLGLSDNMLFLKSPSAFKHWN